MENYYYLIVQTSKVDEADTLVTRGMNEFKSTGVEEYSVNEKRVDEILGERSYSGGDIPLDVLNEVEDVVQKDIVSLKFYFSLKGEALEFSQFLKNEYNITSSIELEEVKDWNEKWKESFSPIYISEKLEIVPSWYENYEAKSEKTLKIYPGMGFGTGTHETTYLCLKLLMDTNYQKTNTSCLDFGCGSGILGLALKELNKDSVIDLYDIDQEALDNCIQNIDYNEMDVKDFGLYLPNHKSKISKEYDIVFANILKNILLDEADFIINSTKSDLILSGLLIGQEEEVINKYTELNPSLEVKNILKKNDWCAVHLRVV